MSYRYGLAVSSQFYFCSLPLRLDAYNRCQFGCTFCFAAARGGNYDPGRIDAISTTAFEARVSRVLDRQKIGSVIDEFLAERQPIHLGGMSDPFPPLEEREGVTLALLRILARHQYPTVISTKSTVPSREPYLSLLASGQFVIQISVTGATQDEMPAIEPGVPRLTDRLNSARLLTEAGVPVAMRLQPLLPGREEQSAVLTQMAFDSGVRHVAVEFLKLPVERSAGIDRLSSRLGFDVRAFYKLVGAVRIGREYTLPVSYRLPHVIVLRSLVQALGMSFGAADTDLLHLSDGESCCSGIDIFARMRTPFSLNYLQAIRRAEGGMITLDHLESGWAPKGSIAQYLNSNSRADARIGVRSIAAHVRENWGGRSNGPSPLGFFGIEAVANGYRTTKELNRLLCARRRGPF